MSQDAPLTPQEAADIIDACEVLELVAEATRERWGDVPRAWLTAIRTTAQRLQAEAVGQVM